MVSLILSAVATVIAVVIAIRSRQFSRPRMTIGLGSPDVPPGYPRRYRRRPRQVLIYGLPPVSRDYFVLPVVISLTNESDIAITNVRLLLRYPAECMLKDAVVMDAEHVEPILIDKVITPGRAALRMGDRADITYDIDLLPPRQTILVYEIVRIPTDHIPRGGGQTAAILERCWGLMPEFRSAFNLVASAWAGNALPVNAKAIIAACEAEARQHLEAIAQKLSWRSRDDRYRRRTARWRVWRIPTELAEVILLPHDALQTLQGELNPAILHGLPHALIEIDTPDGLWKDDAPTPLPPTTGTAAPAAAEPSQLSPRLIFADTDRAFLAFTHAVVGDSLWQFFAVADEPRLLELCQGFKPDVLLLGLGQSGPTAYEVCSTIKGCLPTTVVVFMHDASSQINWDALEACGADDVVPKTLSRQELIDKLGEVVRRSPRWRYATIPPMFSDDRDR
jgi:CheY-like chemotaxis protein